LAIDASFKLPSPVTTRRPRRAAAWRERSGAALANAQRSRPDVSLYPAALVLDAEPNLDAQLRFETRVPDVYVRVSSGSTPHAAPLST
jgi:hypothetical protein